MFIHLSLISDINLVNEMWLFHVNMKLYIKTKLHHVYVVKDTSTLPLDSRAANYWRTSDNVRLNLANVRAKVILIGHWSDHKKKVVTLYIFLL
jgi:hypothetical protein